MNTDYEIQKITWDGIEIEVRWASNWMDYDDGTSMGHLEIQSVAPKHCPLPMTGTGYRSHFMHSNELYESGGPLNFVENWLDTECKSPAWIKNKAAFNQLVLF